MIFGILDKFRILNIFFEKHILFFEIEKNLEKIRNLEKVGYSRNFKDFQWVSLVIGLEGENKNFALATGEGGVGS